MLLIEGKGKADRRTMQRRPQPAGGSLMKLLGARSGAGNRIYYEKTEVGPAVTKTYHHAARSRARSSSSARAALAGSRRLHLSTFKNRFTGDAGRDRPRCGGIP